MNHCQKHLSACLIALAALLSTAPMAWAAPASSLSTFAILSAAPGHGGAVTLTTSTINGDVGSSGPKASVVNTGSTITGSIIAPVSPQVVADFNTALANGLVTPCTDTTTLLPAYTGQTLVLAPGVYCIDAGLTFTNTTLFLNGSATDSWTFIVGTSGTGALTGTSFNVVLGDGTTAGTPAPCDAVTWYVAQAATLTDSTFVGTIYAGAAISITRGTFDGDALAKAAVTLTDTAVTSCVGTGFTHSRSKCNQGVGNGPEDCDPGNSNQGNPFNSNDELGGTPGDPGRKGGNN